MSEGDRDSPSDPHPSRWQGTSDEAADLAELGVITVGDLLTTSARAVAARFPQFLIIMLVVMLPGIAVSIAGDEWLHAAQRRMLLDPYGAGPATSELAGAMLRLGATVVQTVLQFLAEAALMYGTVEFMAGRRAGVLESLAGGFSRAGTVLALALLNTVAMGLALLACIIPGVVVMCVLFASVPAAVTERLGPIEAMQRSADLTTGHRMTIFLALLAIGALSVSLTCVGGMGLGVGTTIGTDPLNATLAARVAGYALEWAIAIFAAMIQAALAAVFYARVRGIRDGVDADAIAKIFE